MIKRYAYALNYYNNQKFNEALTEIENYLKIQPDDSKSLVLKFMILSQISIQEKNYLDAKNYLQQALGLKPDSEEILQLLKRLQNIIDVLKE